jgi:transposase
MMKSASLIIGGVERRRSWTPAEKAQLLEEALQPGASVASVADKHGISRGLFYQWMARARAGLLPGVTLNAAPTTRFVPVKLAKTDAPAREHGQAASKIATPSRNGGVIEIALTNGRVLKVRESIDPAVLAHLADALDKPAS